jgi:hypothetical protein
MKFSGHLNCPAVCNIVNVGMSFDIFACRIRSTTLEFVAHASRIFDKRAEALEKTELGSCGYCSGVFCMFKGFVEIISSMAEWHSAGIVPSKTFHYSHDRSAATRSM